VWREKLNTFFVRQQNLWRNTSFDFFKRKFFNPFNVGMVSGYNNHPKIRSAQ